MQRLAKAHSDKGTPLSPLEAADRCLVIEDHPEYHEAITRMTSTSKTSHVEGGKTNPFLHMGLHLGIREQVATDRPGGIAALYGESLTAKKSGDPHTMPSISMIDCLAETLWEAPSRIRRTGRGAYTSSDCVTAVGDVINAGLSRSLVC